MEFTVQNNSLLYSASFTEETARISIRDLSNGLYESVVTLPVTVWHIIEHQRQQFDTYHQGQVPITENQLGTHAVVHEVAVISGHHYPHVSWTDFPDNYVAGSIQYTFPWEEGQVSNNWFNTPETVNDNPLHRGRNSSQPHCADWWGSNNSHQCSTYRTTSNRWKSPSIWQWNSKLVKIRCENSFWINLIL